MLETPSQSGNVVRTETNLIPKVDSTILRDNFKGGRQMANIVKINNKNLQVKEYQGQRVITFKDIDMVHERPEGTARRNFNENKERFVYGIDYFNVSLKDENRTLGIDIPNRGITVVTESGYLMLVKSLTDDLAWKVQRQLVNNYFRGKQLVNSINELSPELRLLINMELEQKQLKEKTEKLEHRINNLDATNIEGTPRQRLNDMVRKYAYDNGILYPQAWKDFRKSFNTAYRTNIELKKKNYQEKHKIKELTYPEYMERVGLIEDALRVADKMLNKVI